MIKKQSIKERVYSTNCSKTLSDDTIKVIDFILRNKLIEWIKANFFWYKHIKYGVVTANEHKGNLKENTNQCSKSIIPQNGQQT